MGYACSLPLLAGFADLHSFLILEQSPLLSIILNGNHYHTLTEPKPEGVASRIEFPLDFQAINRTYHKLSESHLFGERECISLKNYAVIPRPSEEKVTQHCIDWTVPENVSKVSNTKGSQWTEKNSILAKAWPVAGF